ncbi:BapA/Bap/LapF family prefix-like domain-containing protein, partial [Pacificibacter marinus]|uniref:BapA/Bap/LapF family prefix-like domain-containing protein n=1 Tax=Pacificibacter marinus TaxID=658057 RepID=UPI001C070025
MQTTRLLAKSASDIRIDAVASDINRYFKTSENLIVELNSGDRIVVENFFAKGPSGEVSRLVFSDGAVSAVTGESDVIAHTGLGAGMASQEAILAAGGIGFAGLVAASSASGDTGDTGETGDTGDT